MTVDDAFATRRDNLRRLVMDKFQGNRAAFARAAGVHQNQVNLMLSDNEQYRRNLGEALARKMEGELALSSGWFDVHHDLAATASHLVQAPDAPDGLAHLLRKNDMVSSACFLETYLTTLAGKITAKENLCLYRLATKDMAPELDYDDQVLIDTGVKAVNADGVYLIARGQDVFLRRVSRLLTGGWSIQTPNSALESVKVESLKGIKAVGKVVLAWKAMIV